VCPCAVRRYLRSPYKTLNPRSGQSPKTCPKTHPSGPQVLAQLLLGAIPGVAPQNLQSSHHHAPEFHLSLPFSSGFRSSCLQPMGITRINILRKGSSWLLMSCERSSIPPARSQCESRQYALL